MSATASLKKRNTGSFCAVDFTGINMHDYVVKNKNCLPPTVFSQPPIPFRIPAEFEMTDWGSSLNRVVNQNGVVKRRIREFESEKLGSGHNPHG